MNVKIKINKKILVLYFNDYKSEVFSSNFNYWHTPNDLKEDIVDPLKDIFADVKSINYFQLFGDYGVCTTNRKIIEIAKAFQPDYVFWMPLQYEIYPKTFKKLKRMGCKTMALSFDDSWRAENYVSHWLHDIDILVFNDPGFKIYYSQRKANAFFALFPSASKKLYFRQQVKNKKYDVSFVGSRSLYREKVLNYLQEKGIKTAAFGPGWDCGYLSRADKVDIYNNSKINLSIEFDERKIQFKGRILEVAMTGNFLITQRFEELNDYFEENTSIVGFSELDELLEKINYYLANPGERKRIENCMFEHAKSNYTPEIVLMELFNKIDSFYERNIFKKERYSLQNYLRSRKKYFCYNSYIHKNRKNEIKGMIKELIKRDGMKWKKDEIYAHLKNYLKDLLFIFNPLGYI